MTCSTPSQSHGDYYNRAAFERALFVAPMPFAVGRYLLGLLSK
jgi:hypothetical protein